MRLVVRPAAAHALKSAYRWYEARQTGLGEDLLEAVQAVLERILRMPRSYPVVHRETRRALVQRFPYGVFFRVVQRVPRQRAQSVYQHADGRVGPIDLRGERRRASEWLQLVAQPRAQAGTVTGDLGEESQCAAKLDG